VTFVTLRASEPLAYGLMSLGGALRAAGHTVAWVAGRNAEEIARDPRASDADVLAMSATTGLHRVYLCWARRLRELLPAKCLVLGGPHATFFPQVIEQAPFDGVCIGEGEESFGEFLELWRDGFPALPDGWWIRREQGRGPVERGKERGPVRSLDTLPEPALDLFYDVPRYRRHPTRVFLATRGCPYRCTYCFNRTLNERYRPYGRLVRTHDPEKLADLVLATERRWGIGLVWFLDANFAADQRWLGSFAAVYRRRVGLPFFCKVRPDRVSERVARTLVEAGCVAVGVGIESGSERIRREILGRPASDAEILAGCRRLKASGLRVMSFSMLGIPGESWEEALRTVALNVACGIDHAAATILQPYPGTEIARWAIEHGHFDGNFDRLGYSYFAPSPFRFASERERDRITNLQRLFGLAVEMPEVRTRIRWLVDRPPNKFYHLLFSARHQWLLRRDFYGARRRVRPGDFGRPEQLEAAKQLLDIE
jgi:radical SAM superfamily enzyme YgiQ (UPF0313 family)